MNTQASDPLDVAQGYVDQARCGVGQSAALADGIRVGLADLAAAVRGVMAKPAMLNEERWALLCERAAHVRAACQEMVTQLTATHTATTRAGTQLVRVDVNSLGRQARLQAGTLAVANIGISGVLRLTLPLGARVCVGLAEIENRYLLRDTAGLAASLQVIGRSIDDLAAIAELLAATSAIPNTDSSPDQTLPGQSTTVSRAGGGTNRCSRSTANPSSG